jgi:peptidoglycan/LPS O-acetylase OafA/YrhL
LPGVKHVDAGRAASAAVRTSAALPESLREGLSRPQLPGLDGLRAISAFLVVFYHAGSPLVPGSLGVLAFFVISGFLITWLLLKEYEKYGDVSLKLFYIRRSLRIFPAFYVYWAGVVGMLWLSHKRLVWPQAIASLLYVNNYYQAINGDPNTALSHTWSLGVEEQFYLLWPLAFVWMAGNRERLMKVLAAAIVVVWIHRLTLHFAGVDQGYIYESFDTRADHLLIGCLLAVTLRLGKLPGLWKWLCANTGMPALTFALLIGSSVLNNTIAGYRDTVGFVVEPLLVAALITQLVALSGTALWSWVNVRWVRYLGRISYSVYLYQQIVPGFVDKALPQAPMLIRLLCSVVAVTAAASASYFFVERPFLKLKDRLATR